MTNLDREKVEREAREILDKFARAIEKVEKEKETSESYVEREESERKEGTGEKYPDPEFKRKILENSPVHDDDFIIAEKGGWK